MQDKRHNKLQKVVECLEKKEYKDGWLKLKLNSEGYISDVSFEKKVIFKNDCK